MLEDYLKFLDLGYYEAKFAFEGLADARVWKRPAEGLVSVGELAGHIAYWEAVRLAGEGGEKPEPDLSKCKVSSLLIDRRFAYYPISLAHPPSEQQRAMTAEQVCAELVRVHEESVTHLKARQPDLESVPPGWPLNYTYGEFLRYLTFHVGYHVGQMYTVRHLLGEETPDN